MADYTEQRVLDQVIIDPELGTVFWRYRTTVFKDGVEWKMEYERSSAPIDDPDPSRIPAEVLPYRAMVDTPEVRQRNTQNKDKKPRP